MSSLHSLRISIRPKIQTRSRNVVSTSAQRNKVLSCNKRAKIRKIVNVEQEYKKATLDYTFIDESRLVEEEFPDASSKRRIQSIFDLFNTIDDLVKQTYPNREVREILGPDTTECLLWRRGALMYMYCSTLQEKPTRISKNVHTYIESLSTGISYLDKLLTLKAPFEADPADTSEKNDVQTLLSLGIYSDTHLLAMMYTGEMCYWFCTSEETAASPEKDNFHKIGVKMLQNYLKAVKGPLSVHGWSSDRAEEILKYFQR